MRHLLAVLTALLIIEGAPAMANSREQITVGGGCFWCVEAVFQLFRGVEEVESGYAGGTMTNPDYEKVSAGESGHAEVVRIAFDPAVITLDQILTIFFHAHDPTTKDRQGHDVGSQYRSIILYSNDTQRAAAETVIAKITSEKLWGGKSIVTEVKPLEKFYTAEEYHQNYYQANPSKPYCELVIAPKLHKLKKEFAGLLK